MFVSFGCQLPCFHQVVVAGFQVVDLTPHFLCDHIKFVVLLVDFGVHGSSQLVDLSRFSGYPMILIQILDLALSVLNELLLVIHLHDRNVIHE